MNYKIFAAIAALAFMLVACGEPSTDSETHWGDEIELDEINGEGTDQYQPVYLCDFVPEFDVFGKFEVQSIVAHPQAGDDGYVDYFIHVDFEAVDVWSGTDEEEVTARFFGWSQLDDLRSASSHSISLAVDEEVILFLATADAGVNEGYYRLQLPHQIFGEHDDDLYTNGFHFRHEGISAADLKQVVEDIREADGDCPYDLEYGLEEPIVIPDPPGELLEGSMSRELSPQLDDSIFDQFTADNRDFAFALARQIREEASENFFYSPHSISLALAMLYAGAMDDTKTQMAEALRFRLDEDELHRAFNRLDLMLASRADANVSSGDPPILDIFNTIWGNPGDYVQEFVDTLTLNYGAGIQCVDFANDPEGVRQAINEWIEAVTAGRIKDLLPEDSITIDTALVLTNAIYFLAGWHSPFSRSQTQNRTFTRHDATQVQVPMMRQTFMTGAHLGEETVAVRIPYVGRSLSMIAMMPADGVDYDLWEQSLDREAFDEVIGELRSEHVNLYFPKFEINFGLGLVEALQALGMSDAFGPSAEFYGIAGEPDDPYGLHIADVIHKAFIAVDEEGTEAAAATAVVVDWGENGAEEPPPPVEVRFDRPFYYMIYDHPSGTILFMGALDDPS